MMMMMMMMPMREVVLSCLVLSCLVWGWPVATTYCSYATGQGQGALMLVRYVAASGRAR